MAITKKKIRIDGIPAIVLGGPSKKVYLYVHGQNGDKEEAYRIAEIMCRYGYQVLSVDLPEHGERMNEIDSFDPWHIVPELNTVMQFAKEHWNRISLFANSIGVWFSMISFCNECLDNCLFVSPVLDMRRLISKMMNWANVSEEQLKQERIIPTTFGQTLSWEYWEYALSHPIEKWKIPTKILYGENDNLIDRDIVQYFAQKFHCGLTVMENGEHWFHTQEQLEIMQKWLNQSVRNKELSKKEKEL